MQVNREKGFIEVDGLSYTAKVFTRHGAACKDAARGSGWAGCNCRKSVLAYNGATRKQSTVSAHTRSWQKAEQRAEQWLDQFDPTKREQARQEAQKVSIEDAVQAYLKDMAARNLKAGTVDRNRALLVTKLDKWLGQQNDRPLLISEMTPSHVTAWRATWKCGDQTAAISFDAAKTFFKFCVGQGWIELNPAGSLKRPKIARGSRTATFTDKQYDAILAASKGNERLEAFLELLRWSGMALIDGVLFNVKTLDDAGVLRYKRQKTGTLATLKLQPHVVALLRTLSGEQPFLRKDVSLDACVGEWRRWLQGLFKKAGIMQVQTEIGPRAPHPHMLRDTYAVWLLRNGVRIHSVSKVLGHSNVAITSKHYAPWVKELETAHLEELDEALAAYQPAVSSGNVRSISSRKTA